MVEKVKPCCHIDNADKEKSLHFLFLLELWLQNNIHVMAGFMLYVQEIEGAMFGIPTFSAFGYVRLYKSFISEYVKDRNWVTFS